LVPRARLAGPVVPTGMLSPAGVERALSPARPVAVTVSVAVVGATPQTFATPPPAQVCGAVQAPQVSVPPQPSAIVPQFFPWAAHVVAVQPPPQTFTTPPPPQVCGAVQAPQLSVPPQPSAIAPQFFPCAAQVVGVHTGGVTAGFTVSKANWLTPPAVPEMTTIGDAVNVVTVKVALAAPAGTVTLAGTVAAAVLLLASVTPMPPAGAGPLRVTVPVEEVPAFTVVGLSVSAESVAAGNTFSTALRTIPRSGPPRVAKIVVELGAATALDSTVKVALVAPAGIVTLPGTVELPGVCPVKSMVDRMITAPPAGAGAVRVTVPVEDAGPTTVRMEVPGPTTFGEVNSRVAGTT